MTSDRERTADHKMRFWGILENPIVSRVQRAILDYGRTAVLQKRLAKEVCPIMLDVGCGLADCAVLSQGKYIGIDNSLPRIQYARKRYPRFNFLVGDARNIPMSDSSVDLALLADTSHHLNDQEFRAALHELGRVSRCFVVVTDPVWYQSQSALSRFFYRLDRGACFRTEKESLAIFDSVPGLKFRETFSCRTFPGIYQHQAFILEKTPSK